MNSKTEITKFKYLAGWNIGEFEDYIERMSQRRWTVQKIYFLGMLIKFKKTKSKKISCKIDYRYTPDNEYLSMLQEDNWKLVSFFAGWYIWVKDYEENESNVFSDTNSIIERNKRVIKILSLAIILQVPLHIINYINGISERLLEIKSIPFNFLLFIYFIALLFMVYAIIRLVTTNKNLKDMVK